jgi:hypothetical protein
MFTKLITGLLTATGMIWLLIGSAGALVDWIVQIAAVPADWTGLMTLGAWILVLFFGGGISLAITILVTLLAVTIVGSITG